MKKFVAFPDYWLYDKVKKLDYPREVRMQFGFFFEIVYQCEVTHEIVDTMRELRKFEHWSKGKFVEWCQQIIQLCKELEKTLGRPELKMVRRIRNYLERREFYKKLAPA